jgi:hypothetical protein
MPPVRRANLSAAALTPRVRTLVVCDEATASDAEDGVYSVKGVRHEGYASAFPHRRSLTLYLLLSSPREGVFTCIPTVTDEAETWAYRFRTVRIGFAEENEPMPIPLNLGEFEFPEPGRYVFQIWFTSPAGDNVLKGEQTLRLHQQVE